MARTRTKTYNSRFDNIFLQKIEDIGLLVKFKLSLTVVITSILAYAIAAWDQLTLSSMIILGLGGFFVTSAANALNQVLEKDYDKLMDRTAERPIVKGRMTISAAVKMLDFLA